MGFCFLFLKASNIVFTSVKTETIFMSVYSYGPCFIGWNA